MKACGYDAMTAGNHDWSYGKDRLKELGGIANVKILSGNIKNVDGTSFFDTDALVKEITKNGKILKIGVFGVSDPNRKIKQLHPMWRDWNFRMQSLMQIWKRPH